MRNPMERRLAEAPSTTFAEGLATRVGFALTRAIPREHLDDYALVGESEMRAAKRLLLEKTHNLAEAAGAASLAVALQIKDRLRGRYFGPNLS